MEWRAFAVCIFDFDCTTSSFYKKRKSCQDASLEMPRTKHCYDQISYIQKCIHFPYSQQRWIFYDDWKSWHKYPFNEFIRILLLNSFKIRVRSVSRNSFDWGLLLRSDLTICFRDMFKLKALDTFLRDFYSKQHLQHVIWPPKLNLSIQHLTI